MILKCHSAGVFMTAATGCLERNTLVARNVKLNHKLCADETDSGQSSRLRWTKEIIVTAGHVQHGQ